MQQFYEASTEQLEKAVQTALLSLKEKLIADGLNLDKIDEHSMKVEIISFLLVKSLVEERLANAFDDQEKAYQEAMKMVKSVVVQYRGNTLTPVQANQIH